MKKEQNAPNADVYAQLRLNAEKVLAGLANKQLAQGKDLNTVFQELQVHQIELEMQNDELRIANEELELQRMRFAEIYDLAPVGYFILDNRGIIDEVNTSGLKLFDAHRTDVKGKRLHNFVAADSADEYYSFYNSLLTSAEKQSCQLKLRTKGGRHIHTQVEGTAINKNSQCYITIVDVTEAIEASKTISETKDRLQLALEASSAGAWELHLPSMNMYLDETNHRICNANERGFNNTYASFIDLVHVDDRYTVDQHFRTAVNTGKEIDLICRFINNNMQTCFASIRGHLIQAENNAEGHFVGIMWDITEKKRLEEQAEQLKRDQQKQITTATLYAEESERKRISEALHDSVSQLLYGIKLQLNQVNEQNRIAANARLQELLDMAIKETRNISFELAPPILEDFGLPATIEELCQRLSTPHLKITSVISGLRQRLDLLLETTIFRIVQELVNNCMKHSGANQVQIQLKRNKNIEITVKDNGRGFVVSKVIAKPKGSGISSIKNRLSLYNGRLHIDAASGKGTSVKIIMEV